MALPVIAGVVRASVRGALPSGSPWVNVVHFRYADGASAPGSTEINLLHPKFLRLYTGTAYAGGVAWLNRCKSSVTLIDITYTPLDATSLSVVKTVNAAGSNATLNQLPSEVAMVLSLRTATRGRRYRGRIYLPAPAYDQLTTTGGVDTGTANLGGQTVAQWTGMAADILTNQWKPVVASYGKGTNHGTPTTWAPFATDVVAATVDGQFDVQRRRK
jgi:hypothetical protein